MIIGLEADYYCAYTPVPVRVTPEMYPNMTFNVKIGFEVIGTGRMYQKDGVFYVDLSPWVKIGMHKFVDTRIYYRTGAIEPINEQITQFIIDFVEDDGLGGNTHIQSVTKNFVKCALYGGRYTDNSDRNIKLWKGYPYSWHFLGSMNQSLYEILDGTTTPSVGSWIIEYETSICRGTYLKWLNEYGSYYYWFFPHSREETKTADEYYDVPRDIYNPDKSSNYDTVGFKSEETFIVRDKVKREYWHLFTSLVDSPEVYVLKDGWIDAYQGGATTLEPIWWIKIRQKKVEFERTLYKRSMSELEFEFEYPRPYVQTLI